MPIKFNTANQAQLAEGGEGCIYEYKGKIIKIFKPHINIAEKERKVRMLMSESLPKSVITPKDIVLDKKGRFIGYSMDKINGEEFKRLSNRKFVTANNITTKDILSMLIKVKNILEEIHGKHIFIGDLNDQNILFDKAGNVYLIDCDSWAIGNDKCTVVMDLFKDPELYGDCFNEDTDHYAFMVLAWKSLTRIHPFGGTADPDLPITERMKNRISVIDRPEIRLPRMVKSWKGFSPYLLQEFQAVFEQGVRKIPANMEDMLLHLSFCEKDKEYYYSKFSSCPYCSGQAQIKEEPIFRGTAAGFHLHAVYDREKIKTIFYIDTYLDYNETIHMGTMTAPYQSGTRYYRTENGTFIHDMDDSFEIHGKQICSIPKKHKSAAEVCGNKIYYISPKNTLTQLEITESGNGIKNICPVGSFSYFTVDDGNYCILNDYFGKIIITINGRNIEIDYHSGIINYGIHRDKITGKWMILLEDNAGTFHTFIINGGTVEFQTDSIKYFCPLNCPCISNSTIYLPMDGKIRGYAYQKAAFKDFECSVVSEESRLIKERNKFTIINYENVYVMK